ncbi:unnamed protein product [Tuber aestivum]|uniref:Uncharacterized protein n=1 Tax=Tuber aestivum TaxID=59557 RepID=A0A292Q9V0_9PEZI|nr:unnamed protein product [Tuber aestivum]
MEAKGNGRAVGSSVMSLVTMGQSRQAEERGKLSAVRCAQEKSEGEEIGEMESGEGGIDESLSDCTGGGAIEKAGGREDELLDRNPGGGDDDNGNDNGQTGYRFERTKRNAGMQ